MKLFSTWLNRSQKVFLHHECNLPIYDYFKEDARINWLRKITTISTTHPLVNLYFPDTKSLAYNRHYHLTKYQWIIHPLSQFKIFWDILYTIAITAAISTHLHELAFLWNPKNVWLRNISFFLDVLFSLILFINTILTFCTGYVDEARNVILDKRKIAKRYFKSYFVIDICVIIPWDATYLSEDVKVLKPYNYILSVLHGIILARYITVYRNYKEILKIFLKYHRVRDILVLALLTTGSLYSAICFTRIIQILYTFVFKPEIALESVLNLKEFFTTVNDFTFSSFIYLQHLLMFGPIDVSTWNPFYSSNNIYGALIVLLFILIGRLVLLDFFATILAYISSGLETSISYKRHIYQLKSYLNKNSLNGRIKQNLMDASEVAYGMQLKEETVNYALTDNLRRDLIFDMFGPLFEKIHFVRPYICQYLVCQLHEYMNRAIFTEREYVMKRGYEESKAYFVYCGTVVLFENSLEIGHAEDGDCINEEALLNEKFITRTTAVASSVCVIYTLEKEHFQNVMSIMTR